MTSTDRKKTALFKGCLLKDLRHHLFVMSQRELRGHECRVRPVMTDLHRIIILSPERACGTKSVSHLLLKLASKCVINHNSKPV